MTLPPIFSEGELVAAEQNVVLPALNGIGYVLRDATFNGAASDYLATPATAAGIPCRAVPNMSIRAGREFLRDARDEYVAYWVIWLPLGTDVRITDRLLVNGITFRLLSVSTGQTFPAAVRCLGTEVQ